MAPLVFVTGASSGIGQALAAAYARRGARLALVARRGEVLREWVRAQGLEATRAAVYAADVAEPASSGAASHACLAAQGLPDVLGMAATFQPFVGPMRARRAGTLVGVASVAGVRGLPGHGAYCSSKAAAIAYCESLRGECRPFGVRVVTLLPGYVATPLTARNRYAMPFLLQPDAFAARASGG